MERLFKTSKLMIALTIAVALTFALATVNPASAGKREEVVDWSNGFPSGPHFNLNIHGKNPDYMCDSEPGGGSVFVPEYDYSEIQIIQNKKSSISELTVLDKCAFDDDVVKVQLPTGHFQAYARILAKPKKEGESREVSFYPKLIEACNDIPDYDLNQDGVVDILDLPLGVTDPDLNGDGAVDQADFDIWMSTFGDMTACSDSTLIGLGIVTASGAFTQDGQKLERTKGKSKAVNITDMFMYSGLIFDTSLDWDGDGDLDLDDYIGSGGTDRTGDGLINEDDFEDWIARADELGLYVLDARTEPMWIFDIADLVVYGWDYHNSGAKLVQIRFYPDDQTEYIVE